MKQDHLNQILSKIRNYQIYRNLQNLTYKDPAIPKTE